MGLDPCRSCGACCATLRVDFDGSECPVSGAGVPPEMVVPLTATLVRMRGTDHAAPRCVALAGEIGHEVSCTIYAVRPSPCRDFAPYAALGIGEDGCDRARRRHGLVPLAR